MDFAIFLLIIFFVTFLFATWRICLITVLIRKMFEAQIESQAAILRAQTELLKSSRQQARLTAQLLRAYGHEPEVSTEE